MAEPLPYPVNLTIDYPDRKLGGRLVWWHDLPWGVWNGLTAWIVLLVHVFGGWEGSSFYDVVRSGNWYDFGFRVGAGSPFLGTFGARGRGTSRRSDSD